MNKKRIYERPTMQMVILDAATYMMIAPESKGTGINKNTSGTAADENTESLTNERRGAWGDLWGNE